MMVRKGAIGVWFDEDGLAKTRVADPEKMIGNYNLEVKAMIMKALNPENTLSR